MKNVIFIVCCLLAACNAFPPSVQDFIPGTYVMQSEGKYSIAFDTIAITLYDRHRNSYVIQMRTGYHRFQSGKLQPKELKYKELVMRYNAESQQLEDHQSLKKLTFSPENNTVLFGAAEYQKIN